MFRLIDSNIKFPQLYPRVERKLPTVSDKGWDKVGGFTLRDKETYGVYADYMPQPGLQENLCACECNLIFVCGAATSGKTYAMYLKSLYGITHPGFTATLFSFREKDSQKGSSIFRDGVEVLGNYANCDYVSSGNIGFRFPQYNSQLQLANFNYNVNNPAEWSDFKEDMKKRQSSDIDIDEGTKIEEKAQLYLFSRNRDSSGMPSQMTISFNPEFEHFTCQKVLIPAGYTEPFRNGVRIKKDWEGRIRYFYLTGKTWDTAVWGDTPEEVAAAAGITITDEERAAGMTERSLCKSFTVFTGEAAGNRKLVNATDGQSVANLSASGDADALRGGVFLPRNEEEINISRNIMQSIWDNPINDDENMYATMDIASGKEDSAPMMIWRGLQMIDVDYFKGEPTTLSSWIKSRLDRYNVPVANFAYDSGGHGYWVQALTDGVGVTANRRPMQEYDSSGNPTSTHLEFLTLRSQLLGKLEVMLKSGEISCSIPKDKLVPFGKGNQLRRFIDVLTDGIDLFRTTIRNGKIYYNSKDEFKARFKYSPGELDDMLMRMVFELDTRERKQPSKRVPDNAYFNLVNRPRIANPWRRIR